MSLLLIDGFEDLTSWVLTGGVTSASGGRNGNMLQSSTNNNYVKRKVAASEEHATWCCGMAIKIISGPDTGDASILIFSSDDGAVNHASLVLNTSRILKFVRGSASSGTSLASYSTPLVIGQWYYLEMKVFMHDTTGTYEVKVNNTTQMVGTGADTKNAGTKTVFDTLKIGSIDVTSGSFLSAGFDDLYLLSGAGTAPQNDFLGDLAVETLYPDGMDVTTWTGSDGNAVDNYLLIDEAGTPVDTDYVQSSTVGAREMYTVQPLVRTTGTVPGVMVQCRANKSDSGPRGLKVVAKESGGTIRSSADNALTTTFTDYPLPLEKKNDNSAWTVADVNALNIGVEVGS
jgi:hypothetical protein